MTWKGRTAYLLAWCAVGAGVWLYVDRREVAVRYDAYQESSEKVRLEALKTAALGQDVEQLQERVRNLHSNPLEMESAIRRTKGLVRPGETVYRISEEKLATPPTGTATGEKSTAAETPTAHSGALEAISPDLD